MVDSVYLATNLQSNANPNMSVRLLQLFVFSVLILLCRLAPAVQETRELRTRIQAVLDRHGVPGASVAVVVRDKIVWSEGIGVADVETKQPVDKGTLFQAASISKPICAAGALRMVDEGKLDLDKPVSDFSKSNESKWAREVTLRQLLSHSSGLAVHGFAGYQVGHPIPNLLQILSGTPPANSNPILPFSKPGVFKYSGGGYCVVQQLVEDAAGKEFSEAMNSIVLSPLKMTQSTFTYPLPKELSERVATGHDTISTAIPGRHNVYPEKAAAGLWTTASDLAKFAIAIQQSHSGAKKSFLRQGTAKQMLTAQSEGGPGLGLFMQGDSKSGTFEHGGVNSGFQAQLFATKNPGNVIVIMTNSDNGSKAFGEIIGLFHRSK